MAFYILQSTCLALVVERFKLSNILLDFQYDKRERKIMSQVFIGRNKRSL